MKINVGGVWKPVTALRVNVAGAWKNVTKVRVNVGGVWKDAGTYLTALSATINDAAPSGRTFGTNPVSTNVVTVTPSGGLAPYTYSWALISGRGSPESPTMASTRFSEYVDDYGTAVGLFRCTVTDALGATVTVDADATFNNFGPGGL